MSLFAKEGRSVDSETNRVPRLRAVEDFHDPPLLGADYGDLDGVLKFPDVSRPVACHKVNFRARVQLLLWQSVPAAKAFEEVVHKQRYVLPALAQGRQVDGEDIDAVEEIFAKPSFGNSSPQIHICGGNHAGVEAHGLDSADAVNLALL